MKKRIGKCSQCGRDAAVNVPKIYDGEVWCNYCSDKDRTGKLFLAIEQWTDEDENYVLNPHWVSFNGTSATDKGKLTAWTPRGSIVNFLTSKEKEMSLAQLVQHLSKESDAGITRCTSCGVRMQDEHIAGRPLFAGVNCTECWQEHLKKLEDERRGGHVCRRCREPYSNCCC